MQHFVVMIIATTKGRISQGEDLQHYVEMANNAVPLVEQTLLTKSPP